MLMRVVCARRWCSLRLGTETATVGFRASVRYQEHICARWAVHVFEIVRASVAGRWSTSRNYNKVMLDDIVNNKHVVHT